MPSSAITPRYVNVIFTSILLIPVLAIFFDATNVLGDFAIYGHDKISIFLVHVLNHALPYSIFTVSVLALIQRNLSQIRREEDNTRARDDTQRDWQRRVEQKDTEYDSLRQRLENFKKNLSETVAACGQVIFNADDSLSLQHLFCTENHKMQQNIDSSNTTIRGLRTEIRFLNSDMVRLRRENALLNPNSDSNAASIVADHEDAVRTRDERIAQLQIESDARKTEVEELTRRGNDLKEIEQKLVVENANLTEREKILTSVSTQLSEAQAEVERLNKELSTAKEELVTTNADHQEETDLQMEMVHDETNRRVAVQNQLKALQDQYDAVVQDKATLEGRVSSLEKDVHDKVSDIDFVRRQAIEDVRSAKIVNDRMVTELQAQINTLNTVVTITNRSRRNTVVSTPPRVKTPIVDNTQAIADISARSEAELNRIRGQHAQELAARDSEIESLRARVQTGADIRSSTEYQEASSEIARLYTENNHLRQMSTQSMNPEQLQQALDTHTQLQNAYNDRVAEVTTLTDRVNTLQIQVTSRDQTIVARDEIITQKDEEIAKQAGDIEQKNKTIEDLFEAVPEANQGIINTHDSAIKILNAQMDAKEAAVQVLERRIIERDTTIARLEKQVHGSVTAANNREKMATLEKNQALERERVAIRVRDLSLEDTTRARAERDHARGELTNMRNARDVDAMRDLMFDKIHEFLDGLGLGSRNEPLSARVLQNLETVKQLIDDPVDNIIGVLDRMGAANTRPDGENWDTLQDRVSFVVTEYVRLHHAASVIASQRGDITATSPSSTSAFQLPEDINIIDPLWNITPQTRSDLLSRHRIDLDNLTDPYLIYIYTGFQDAFRTRQTLRQMHLFREGVNSDLEPAVRYLAGEHNRHWAGATQYVGLYGEIERELDGWFGPVGQGGVWEAPVERVRRLIGMVGGGQGNGNGNGDGTGNANGNDNGAT